MPTPKNILDIRFQNNVIHVSPSQNVDTEANRFFHEIFGNKLPVSVNFLFEEDAKRVYEAYQDSGSDDYLYLVK